MPLWRTCGSILPTIDDLKWTLKLLNEVCCHNYKFLRMPRQVVPWIQSYWYCYHSYYQISESINPMSPTLINDLEIVQNLNLSILLKSAHPKPPSYPERPKTNWIDPIYYLKITNGGGCRFCKIAHKFRKKSTNREGLLQNMISRTSLRFILKNQNGYPL